MPLLWGPGEILPSILFIQELWVGTNFVPVPGLGAGRSQLEQTHRVCPGVLVEAEEYFCASFDSAWWMLPGECVGGERGSRDLVLSRAWEVRGGVLKVSGVG